MLSALPLPLFTLLASLCRCKAVHVDVCKSGLLQLCLDRFVLDTDGPNNLDAKVCAPSV